jgi:exodeoxyribonuclease VII large subunit
MERQEHLAARLQRAHPGVRLRQQVQRLDELDLRLRGAWENRLSRLLHRLQLAQRSLDAISPLATLARGYAIVTGPDGVVVQDASRLQIGDEIEARLATGRLRARVTGTAAEPDQTP